MLVVHFPSWFPDAERPLNGNFILRQMEAVGHYSEAILLRHASPDLEYSIPENVHFHPIYCSQKRKLPAQYISEFQNIIKTYGKPDAIHLHVALPLGPIAAFLARKHNIPLIISEHWSIYQTMNRSLLKSHQRCALRYTYKNAAHITAVSQNLLDNIVATVRIAAKKPNTVVGNVVNTDIFTLKPAIPARPRKQILHVSTLDNDAKNIMGILHAVDALSQRRDDFELNIVHDFRNILAETYVRERGLDSIVHFMGQKTSSEIASLLHDSDFFLIFSNYENQPCVLLESFCTGTPAIATTVGGIPEITNKDNAVLVTPKDETQLIEKLEFMLDNTEQFNAKIIRNNALAICSPEIIGEKYLKIYQLTFDH
jgi:glycosyltransferase involved in cell wall biosynthesis